MSSILQNTGMALLTLGGAAAGAYAVMRGVPPMEVSPLVGASFGMAVPFFGVALERGLDRAARWFAPAAKPTAYVQGTWAKGDEALVQGERISLGVLKTAEENVNVDLRLIVETVKDGSKLLSEIDLWVRQQKGISDADYFYVLEHLPRGMNVTEVNRDIFIDMAGSGLRTWRSELAVTKDLKIIHAALKRIDSFRYPERVAEIGASAQKFLTTIFRWKETWIISAYEDEIKADLVRYFYREGERLKNLARFKKLEAQNVTTV